MYISQKFELGKVLPVSIDSQIGVSIFKESSPAARSKVFVGNIVKEK